MVVRGGACSNQQFQIVSTFKMSSVLQSDQWKNSQKGCWGFGDREGLGLFGCLVVFFPKIDNVNLQTDIRPFCCGGGSQLCGQDVDLERRSLDSSFCCCSQISAGEFVLIILSWTENRFEPRPNKPVAYEVSCLSSSSFL